MPLDPISAVVVTTVIGGVMQEIANLPPPVPPVPEVGVPRMLPGDTKMGEMTISSPTNAIIDGQPMLLAPGVQIRDPFNVLVLPGMVSRAVPVRYQTDLSGAISRVWILSQQEAAARP